MEVDGPNELKVDGSRNKIYPETVHFLSFEPSIFPGKNFSPDSVKEKKILPRG